MALLTSGDLWYYRTPAAIASVVAYPGPVKINLASFNNLNQAKRYLMLFDLPKIPADGALPLIELAIQGDGMTSYTPAFGGRRFNNGFVVALSTTPVKLTVSTSLEMTFQIEGRIG